MQLALGFVQINLTKDLANNTIKRCGRFTRQLRSAKASAQAKLAALGLTADEVAAVTGAPTV